MGLGTGLCRSRLRAHFAQDFEVRFIQQRTPEIRRRDYLYQRRGLALSPPAEAFVKLLSQRAARGDG